MGALKTRVNMRKHSFFNENVNKDMMTRNFGGKARVKNGNQTLNVSSRKSVAKNWLGGYGVKDQS